MKNYTNTHSHKFHRHKQISININILFYHFFFSLPSFRMTTTTTTKKRISCGTTDIMRKTVKLMISISNKSNPITTNTSLILREIMRCLHQHRTLIYWRATTIQPIQIQIGIIITIIDIRMPRRVRKVRNFDLFIMFWNRERKMGFDVTEKMFLNFSRRLQKKVCGFLSLNLWKTC